MAKRTATIEDGSPAARTVGRAIDVHVDALRPNSWNPNVQNDWMFQKELASIREFGFVDPIIVRQVEWADTTTIGAPKSKVPTEWEIIDGEHRWKAARELGYTEVPCWDLGEIDDDTARQLTIVLNETRGRSDEGKLQALIADLVSRRPEQSLREVLPFSKERFDELMQARTIDWGVLEERRQEMQQDASKRWKELVFRLPGDAAAVVEEALDKLCAKEGLSDRWQALEMLAADYLA